MTLEQYLSDSLPKQTFKLLKCRLAVLAMIPPGNQKLSDEKNNENRSTCPEVTAEPTYIYEYV